MRRYVVIVVDDTEGCPLELAELANGKPWRYDISVDGDDDLPVSSCTGWPGPVAALRAAADDIERMTSTGRSSKDGRTPHVCL